MTNREKIESLNNNEFINTVRAIAFSPWFEFVDWDKWLNADTNDGLIPGTAKAGVNADCKEEQPVNRPNPSRDWEPKKVKKEFQRGFTPSDTSICRYEHGRMIREARNKKRISVSEMAEILGVKPPTYTSMETGSNSQNDIHLNKIAEILDIDIAELQNAYDREFRKAAVKTESEESLVKDTYLSRMFKKAMKSDSMSYKQCATELGVSENTIKHWMNGETIPEVERTSAVVTYFKFDYDEYMSARRMAKAGILADEEQVDNRQCDIREFGRLVQQGRLSRRLSQMTVDESLKFPVGTTEDVENGRAGLVMSMVNKYAQLFSIDLKKVMKKAG